MSHYRASSVGHLAGHYTKVVALTFYLENYDTIETCLDVDFVFGKLLFKNQRLLSKTVKRSKYSSLHIQYKDLTKGINF